MQFEDYRKIYQDEKMKYVNDKPTKLTIHEKLRTSDLDNVMMDSNDTSLNPCAIYDEKSVYPTIEKGFAFKPYMIDVYVEVFTNQTFNQDGIESASLKIKHCNPPNLIFNYLPVKEKFENVEIN